MGNGSFAYPLVISVVVELCDKYIRKTTDRWPGWCNAVERKSTKKIRAEINRVRGIGLYLRTWASDIFNILHPLECSRSIVFGEIGIITCLNRPGHACESSAKIGTRTGGI